MKTPIDGTQIRQREPQRADEARADEPRADEKKRRAYSRPVVRSSSGFNKIILATDCQGACQIQFAGITT